MIGSYGLNLALLQLPALRAPRPAPNDGFDQQQPAPAADQLAQADRDRSGALSPVEFDAMIARAPDVPRVSFEFADEDHDGVVDAGELVARRLLWRTLDRLGDAAPSRPTASLLA